MAELHAPRRPRRGARSRWPRFVGGPGARAHRRPRRDHRGPAALPHHRRPRPPRRRGPVGWHDARDPHDVPPAARRGPARPHPAGRARVTEVDHARHRGAARRSTCGAAQALIDDDDEIDALALDIEERCYHAARPAAADGRATCAPSSPRSGSRRRSSGPATSWSTSPRRPGGIYGIDDPTRAPRACSSAMSDEALRLFRLAIDAYADGDAGLAAALDDMDDRLDQLHTRLHPGDPRACHAEQPRRPGRGAARARRPLLRAHRRPRREHRRAGALHGHRLAARAHRRGARRAARSPAATAPADDRRRSAALVVVLAGALVLVLVGGAARRRLRRLDGRLRLDVEPAGIGLGEADLGRSSGRSTAPCCGAARRRRPRPGWPARSRPSPRASSSATTRRRSSTATTWRPASRRPPRRGAGRRGDRRAARAARRRAQPTAARRRPVRPAAAHARARRPSRSTTAGAPVGALVGHRRRHRAPPPRGRAPRLRRQHQPRAEDAGRRARPAGRDAARRGRPRRRRGGWPSGCSPRRSGSGRTIDDLLELSPDRGRGGAPARAGAGAPRRRRGRRAHPARRPSSRASPSRSTSRRARLAVLGDRRQLVSAIYNLLENAVKYSDAGSTGRGARPAPTGADVEIDVRRPRHRHPAPATSSGSSSASTGSTGPAAARPAAPASAWPSCATSPATTAARCRVESREGEGSTFTLRLPVGPGRSPSPPRQAEAPMSTPETTVLVVEDEDSLRRGAHGRARSARASACRSPATAPRRSTCSTPCSPTWCCST